MRSFAAYLARISAAALCGLLAPSALAADGQIDIRPTGSATLVISNSGSYVLVDNVSHTPTINACIQISASNVTLDLNGHTVSGPMFGTSSGIVVQSVSNVRIVNGTISSFGGPGITVGGLGSGGVEISKVTVRGCRSWGIAGAKGTKISDCIVFGNNVAGGAGGIAVDSDSIIRDCVVYDNDPSVPNTSTKGISAAGSLVENNRVFDNNCSGGTTAVAVGIEGFAAARIVGNVVTNNDGDTVIGVSVGEGGVASGNTIANHTATGGAAVTRSLIGIQAFDGCVVEKNVLDDNGCSAAAAGDLYVIEAGNGCVVSGNTVQDSDQLGSGTAFGISAFGTGSVVSGNSVQRMNASGSSLAGIQAGGGRIVDNVVMSIFGLGTNTSTQGISTSTFNGGIVAGNVVRDVFATGTGTAVGMAINVSHALVENNNCSRTFGGSARVGIEVGGPGLSGTLLRGNTTSENTIGIRFATTNSDNRAELNRMNDGAIVNPPLSVGLGDLANIAY